jgi:hypothetical protein
MVYKHANINLTKAQIEKAIKGKPIRVHNSQLGSGSNVILLHPTNYKLIEQSIRKNKGITLYLAPGELNATLDSDIQGTGFIDWIRDKALPWLKKNAPILKPIASAIADAGTALVPSLAPARAILKQTTGIGAMPKKTRMTKPKGSGLYLSKPYGNGLYL